MLTVLTIDELIANALAAIRIKFPTRSTHPESWLYKQAVALAGLIWSVHDQVQQADYDATPQAKSTYDALAQWAFVFGLSNGAGGYGPKGATAATGLDGAASGTPAAVIWNGAGSAPTLVARDGVTFFALSAAATVGGGGSVSVSINATTTGTAGNLTIDDTLTFVSTIPGVNSSVTVTTGSTNGADKESHADLLARLLYRLQNPPRAITAPDLRQIAEGVTGVYRTYVYPIRQGGGSADILITASLSSGGGTARDPGATVRTNVATQIAADRNVTATITVYRPQFGAGLNIRARITAQTGFGFDWDDGGTAATVKVGGTTTLLRINGSPPAALVTAVAAGNTPRIQVVSTTSGAPVEAAQPRVTNVDIVTINPDTILTLATALTVYPTAADKVYAGGGAVAYCQQAIVDYVNALGPSRDSGFADPDDAWLDDATISELIRVVLDAVDESDTRVATGIVFVAMVPQVTINGAVADYNPPDTGGSGIYLAYVKNVAVTG